MGEVFGLRVGPSVRGCVTEAGVLGGVGVESVAGNVALAELHVICAEICL